MKKCPICGGEVVNCNFEFPKLPASSPFSSIFGSTHISCLLSHPQRTEIQNELTNIYLKIFGEHPNFPIVAQAGLVLIKSRPDCQLLEIYDFQDFVSFYIPYNQIEILMKMESGQKLSIGVNAWTTLISNDEGKLTISHCFPKEKKEDRINLPHLNLHQLKQLVSEASMKL